MIDVMNEQIIVFNAVSKRLPNRPHISTLHRWRTRGIRGVRLEAILVGGIWCTSNEALSRFFTAATIAAGVNIPHSTDGPKPAYTKENHLIIQTLDDAGI